MTDGEWWSIDRKDDPSDPPQTVNSLDGIDPEVWNITPLEREPEVTEKVEDGQLVEAPELQEKLISCQTPDKATQEYVMAVITTLFPLLVITEEQMKVLFPDLPLAEK